MKTFDLFVLYKGGASMNRELVIDSTRISNNSDCYVIAEIGHNHQSSLQMAKELFRAVTVKLSYE